MKALIILLSMFIGSAMASEKFPFSTDQSPFSQPILLGITVKPLEEMELPALFVQLSKSQYRQMNERGYVDATQDEVIDMQAYMAEVKLLSMDEIMPRLTIVPQELRGTGFDNAKFLGANFGGGYVDDGWTSIERFYKFKKLGIVKFDELDYLVSGSGIVLAQEFINENINGHNGVYVVKETRRKRVVSELMWYDGTKMYTLTVAHKIARNDAMYKRLINLAKSI